jgi:hypothetical protein
LFFIIKLSKREFIDMRRDFSRLELNTLNLPGASTSSVSLLTENSRVDEELRAAISLIFLSYRSFCLIFLFLS